MRDERRQLTGDFTVGEELTLWGKIAGNVTVSAEGRFYLRGSVFGDLVAEPGARVHIFGNLQGNLTVEPKAKVIVSGIIGGDVINRGGRLYIELLAKVMGKVKTKDGETTFEPRPQKFVD
jgi:cytoskeletal protein CcmA (bactofilin family)